MVDTENQVNEIRDDFFVEIKKHKSFTKLTDAQQNELESLFKKTLEDSKQGKWLIDKSEVVIEDPPFASGSFSTIHNCNWRGIDIAVKCPLFSNLINIVDLLKEIQIWNTLRHPNLVQFMGFSYNRDSLFILMEKVNGVNLKQYLNSRNTSNNIYKNKEIVTQLINVFKFLHNCNPPIIYRDLKPENILLCKDNTIKLTDFGLSKYFVTTETEEYQMTGMTGTLRYMAPEVFLKKSYDLKIDIYSLGLVMYYIFTNEPPFSKYNTTSMTNFMNMEHVVFSTNKIRNESLKTIIDKCIDKDPRNRYNINELYFAWMNFISTNKPSCVIM